MASRARVVLSDLDDTLFDHRRATRSALAAVHADEPALARTPFDELDRRHRALLDLLHLDVLAGRRSIDEARVERFRRLLEEGYARDAAQRAVEVARGYRRAYEGARFAVPGAIALAAGLRRARIPLVIVTNNIVEEQRLKLAETGLAAYVDVLITSEEVGASKPDSRIFLAALDRVAATAADAVMLGDAWTTDIVGAQGAGIRAVWFNRFGEPSPDPSVPELHDLEPLDRVLSLLGASGLS